MSQFKSYIDSIPVLNTDTVSAIYEQCFIYFQDFHAKEPVYIDKIFSWIKDHLKEGWKKSILTEYFINHNPTSSQYISAYKLLNSVKLADATDNKQKDCIDYRTFESRYGSLIYDNPSLNDILLQNRMIVPTPKGKLSFNENFVHELNFLQYDFKRWGFLSSFLSPDYDMESFEEHLAAIQDFIDNSEHKNLVCHFLNRKYKLDYFIASFIQCVSYLKSTEQYTIQKRHPFSIEEWIGDEEQYKSMYNDLLSQEILCITPTYFLNFEVTRQACLHFFSDTQKQIRQSKEPPHKSDYVWLLTLRTFAFAESTIYNLFMYGLRTVGSKNPPHDWSAISETKDSGNIPRQKGELLSLFQTARSELEKLPFTASSLLSAIGFAARLLTESVKELDNDFSSDMKELHPDGTSSKYFDIPLDTPMYFDKMANKIRAYLSRR